MSGGRTGGRGGVARTRGAGAAHAARSSRYPSGPGDDQCLAVGVRSGDVAADRAGRDIEAVGELGRGRPVAAVGEDLDESLPLLGQNAPGSQPEPRGVGRCSKSTTRRRGAAAIGTEFPGVRKPIWWSRATSEQNRRKRLRLRPTRSTTTGLPVARRHGRCASSWSAAPAPRARSSRIASVVPRPPVGSRCARGVERVRPRRGPSGCRRAARRRTPRRAARRHCASVRSRHPCRSPSCRRGRPSAADGEEALDLALATAGAGS